MSLVPSPRTWSPSSRKPGSGKSEGTSYRTLERLTPEERNQRAADCWRWACARGEERERLKAAYEQRWCGAAPPPPPCPACERPLGPNHDCFDEQG